MRIAYVTSVYPAVSQTFIVREVKALRQLGFEIDTYSVRRATKNDILGEESEAENARTRWLLPLPAVEFAKAIVWTLFRPVRAIQTLLHGLAGRNRTLLDRARSLAYFAEAILLGYWLHRSRAEHLHCHFGNSGSSAAALAARLVRVPFSMTCHGSELREIESFRLPAKVEQAKFVACVSHFGKTQLMLHCPIEQWRKLHIVHCGLDEATMQELSSGPHHERNGALKLVCVARLSPEKGHLVLLDSIAALQRNGTNVRCKLVGDGPQRRLVEDHARRVGADEFVSFAGALDFDQVMKSYSAADAVVLASFSEGVPVTLMEALAAERPVVATNVGGVGELVVHGETGLLVPPGDSEALYRSLKQLADDPVRAKQMAVRGREHVQKEFRVELAAKQLAELFRSGVSASGGSSGNDRAT